jgi:hypothetical protein
MRTSKRFMISTSSPGAALSMIVEAPYRKYCIRGRSAFVANGEDKITHRLSQTFAIPNTPHFGR